MTDWSTGSPAPAGATALPALTKALAAPSDLVSVLNKSDTSTAPANSAGSNQAATVAQVRGVLQPSGSATAQATLIQSALSALSAPGDVYIQGGVSWSLEAGIISQATASGYGIVAVGGRARITGAGTGTVISWHDSSNIATRTIHGGRLIGLDIDVSGMGNGSTGFELGDIYQLDIDIAGSGAVTSGSSSVNVRFLNAHYFAEDMTGKVKSQNGPLVYDKSGSGTGSYDRSSVRHTIQTGGLCDGVYFKAACFVVDPQPGFSINGNTAPGASEFAVLRIGSGAGIFGGPVNIGVEQNGEPVEDETVATTTVLFDDDTGQIYFISGSWDFSGDQPMTSCAAPQQIAHGGTVSGDSNISPLQWGAASGQNISADGQMLFAFPFRTLTTSTSGASYKATVLSPGSVDGQRVDIEKTDSGSITFDVPGTSNVALGTADVIAGNSIASYRWNADKGLWYRVGGPGTFGGNLLVDNPASYATGTFVGQSASGQFSNFNLADNVYPLDAAGHYWAFSHRDDHTLAIFNYNGSVYTSLLSATEAGQLSISTTGKGLSVAEGSNAKQGTAVLVAGSKVVSNTSVTANSRIFLTSQADGGTPGWLRVSARTAGTSFTITSSSATDTSTVAYEIFEPS